MTSPGSAVEQVDAPEGGGKLRLGHVRWTICAMLFVATSINYMDRQVIAILKPTLQHSIGMTEVDYGYIIFAFQLAYAVGVLAAGRLIDKLGTRVGYCVFMGIWSLSAMGHALASSALEFGFARFFLGLGESGNFPRRSRRSPSGFRRGSARWRRGFLIPGPTWERFSRRSLCRGWRCTIAGEPRFWSPAFSACCGSSGGTATIASRRIIPR
jgi:hypothetical protein